MYVCVCVCEETNKVNKFLTSLIEEKEKENRNSIKEKKKL